MLVGVFTHYFFGISIFLTSLFLVMLVLVQRGRGGGIAGALGGAGGQSAFGTKAGDLFTRITVGVATFWILLCCAAILTLKERSFSTGIEKQQAKSGAVSGGGEASPPGGGEAGPPGGGEAGPPGGGEAGAGSSDSVIPSAETDAISPPANATAVDPSLGAAIPTPPAGASSEATGGEPAAGSVEPAPAETTSEQPAEQPKTGDQPESSQVSPEVNEIDGDSAINTPDE